MEEPIDFLKIFELNNDYFKRNAITQWIEEEWLDKIEREDLERLKESSIVLITRFEKPLKERKNIFMNATE